MTDHVTANQTTVYEVFSFFTDDGLHHFLPDDGLRNFVADHEIRSLPQTTVRIASYLMSNYVASF